MSETNNSYKIYASKDYVDEKVPSTDSAYMQLVTNGDGEAEWAELQGYVMTENAIVPEQTVTTELGNNYAYTQLSGGFSLIVGKTYTVVINGEQYECEAWSNASWGAVCLGNGTIVGVTGGDDEPFEIDSYSNGNMYLCTTDSGEYTVSIVGEKVTVKKLDEESVPFPIRSGTAEGSLIFNNLNNVASGAFSHAEGDVTIAKGSYSHAEGCGTAAKGRSTHAEGENTIANSSYAHAEGYATLAYSSAAHAEGNRTFAGGNSHSEGSGSYAQNFKLTGDARATTLAYQSYNSDYMSPGNVVYYDKAAVIVSVDTAQQTITLDNYISFSALDATPVLIYAGGIAYGDSSHAEGFNTIAGSNYQHVQGKYNVSDYDDVYAHIVGNGTSVTDRSNAHTLDWSGNAWFAGAVKVGGTGQDDETAKEVVAVSPVTTDDNGKLLGVVDGAVGLVELQTETWTFTLEDGTTVTKNVVVK